MITEETRRLAELINETRHKYNNKRQKLIELRESDKSIPIKLEETLKLIRDISTIEGYENMLVIKYRKSLDIKED